MKRKDAIKYVSYVIDDSGMADRLNTNPHAVVTNDCWLIGWQCGFEPMFVAVRSYLNVKLTCDDAMEIAQEYLTEIRWFSDNAQDNAPNYAIEPLEGK